VSGNRGTHSNASCVGVTVATLGPPGLTFPRQVSCVQFFLTSKNIAFVFYNMWLLSCNTPDSNSQLMHAKTKTQCYLTITLWVLGPSAILQLISTMACLSLCLFFGPVASLCRRYDPMSSLPLASSLSSPPPLSPPLPLLYDAAVALLSVTAIAYHRPAP
jgi:hypothetical protein